MTERLGQPGPSLDPELIAAFLDGRLDERQRQDVLALLADSREARELVAEASALLHELEGAGDAGDGTEANAASPVQATPSPPTLGAPRAWWRRPRVALPLAASVALAAALTAPLLRGPAGLGTAQVEALLPVPLVGRSLSEPPAAWSRTRGGVPEAERQAMAFRAGYRMVDLARAASLGDDGAAGLIAAELSAALRSESLSAPARAALQGMAEASAGGADRDRRRLLDAADREMGSIYDADWLLLGRWVAGAEAAVASDPESSRAYFHDRATRRTWERLLEVAWPPEVHGAVDRVAAALAAAPDGSGADLAAALAELSAAGGR